ncbi:MAG: O-antigen ligase family protein [Clostridia bacterium]|nr:O-antigen ligase family protein [Clostridia bacterium]
MEYFLSFLILALNLYNYEKKLNAAVMFMAGLILISLLLYFVFKRTRNFIATCLISMVYTWQISWMNIFGDPTSKLQLPWLYLLGLLIVIYGVVNIGSCFNRRYNFVPTLLFLTFILIMLYPLIISESISSGAKELGNIGFFIAVLFISYLYKDTVSKEVYDHFKKAIIWAVLLSSLFIILQYTLYNYAGIRLFKVAIRRSYSGYQTSFFLLMGDHSSASIMLGCAIFYILDRLSKKNWYYMIPAMVVILVSMAATSRRSSTIPLFMVIAVFVIFHYRNVGKKILFSIILGLGSIIMMYYLLVVRPVDSFSQILSDNGRFAGYLAALKIIIQHPFGIGYDDDYLTSFMPNNVTPHNTILRWAVMGGIVFAVILVLIVLYCIRTARQKKLTTEFWVLIYAFFSANLIPDILAARFFVLFCSMALLAKGRNEVPEEYELPNPALMKNGPFQHPRTEVSRQ